MHPQFSKKFCIQEIEEPSGIVVGFRSISGDFRRALPVANGPTVIVGGSQIFAFITEDNALHVGLLSELETSLRGFSRRRPDSLAIALQIMELIGDDDDKRRARIRMRSHILSRAGNTAARAFYEGSVLRSLLWEKLIKGASSSEAAARILRARSKIGLSVETEGSVTIDLSTLDPKDYDGTSNLHLSYELQREVDFISDDSGPSGHALHPSYRAVIEAISQAGGRNLISFDAVDSLIDGDASLEYLEDFFSTLSREGISISEVGLENGEDEIEYLFPDYPPFLYGLQGIPIDSSNGRGRRNTVAGGPSIWSRIIRFFSSER
jgi:hypothetical protein